MSRSLKATHKNGKKQITPLDCSIKRKMSNGEYLSFNSKCRKANREILNGLNTSKSVLDNLIFSNQEESEWTLFKGKKLKQLLDDLMELSIDYKDLDNIHERKIENEKDIKQCKTGIKFLKIYRDKAQKKLSEKGVLELKIAEFNAKIKDINEKLSFYESFQSEMDELSQELALMKLIKTATENKIESWEKENSEPLNHDIAVSLIADSEQQLEGMKSEITSIEKQIADLKSQNKDFCDTNNTLLVEKGGLVTQIEAQKVRQEKFNSRLTQLCAEKDVEHNEASASLTMKNLHDRISQDEEILNDKLIKDGQQEYSSISSENDDKKQELLTIESSIQSNQESLKPMKKELSSMKSDLEILQQKRKSIEKDSRSKINNLTNQVRDLENIFGDIKKFKKENVQERLNDLDKRITKNNEELNFNNDSINRMETTIEVHKSTIDNNKIKNRELADTLEIRHCHANIVALDTKIQSLEKYLPNLSYILLKLSAFEKTRLLKKDLKSINFQKNRTKNKIISINQICLGRYANAEPDYLEMIGKMKVIENQKIDLEKKFEEFEQAIMHHHDLIMNEINKILKELWRNIYSGDGTEYIEICRYDETLNISKRRNYNYRTMMVKSGDRLDMLASCSSNQHELATILIRLALAEVFNLHCGVLCLDDPTKHLDQESIENLARVLVKIINDRSKQKNFQLILLTHDEKFLQLLARSYFVNEFYEIKCNSEGHSEIKKTRIDHR